MAYSDHTECRFCSGYRDELETALEEVRQLREQLNQTWKPPLEWKLSPVKYRIMCALMRRKIINAYEMFDIIKDDEDFPFRRNLVSTHISLLKKDMKERGIVIQNIYGSGYFIDADTKQMLNEGVKKKGDPKAAPEQKS